MKVLMISKLAPWHSNAGGMENHVYELSNNLKREGIEVIHLFWENKCSKDKDIDIKYYGIRGRESLNTFFASLSCGLLLNLSILADKSLGWYLIFEM